MPLSDTKIRNTKPGPKPIKLSDGAGLYLEVRPSGVKLWRYRYRIAGKENVFAMGEYPTVGLADARATRAEARELVKQGIHPAHKRYATKAAQVVENANTFQAVALEWLEQCKGKWTPYYLRQVNRFLTVEAFPAIGALPIRGVTTAHLLEIIKRLEKRGAETSAILGRQWCGAIFRYAVATLRAEHDPTAALKGAIHRPRVEHCQPLSREQIACFVKAVDDSGGYRTTVIALRLLLLTFVRTVELRGARWSEIDLDRSEWRIPSERMKMRQAHRVPLSRQALDLLQELHSYTGGRDFLFPNYRNPQTHMTSTTVNRALERMGFSGKDSIGFSAHGFRATASTILNEIGFRPDVIERQLAHAERNKVRSAYNRAEYWDERKVMMQEWADLIDHMADTNVTPFRIAV